MNQKNILILAVILGVSLSCSLTGSGCVPQPQNQPQTPAPTATPTPSPAATPLDTPVPAPTDEYTDQNKTIVTITGNQFTITLPANPTTGYEWNANFNSTFVNLVENKFIPATGEGKVGVGGEQLFTFIALKTGTTDITLIYKRSWEQNFVDQRIFTINIK